MNERMKISVSLTPDAEGFIGRECPKCEEYFKVKPGTGLPIQQCICPYCGHQGPGTEFFTKDQIEYAKSFAIKKAIDPILDSVYQRFKKYETSTGFIQIKVGTSGSMLRINHYQEKVLETNIVCDNCKLNFSIYGVFSNCPDCGKLNVRVIFEKSIEASKKKIELSKDDKIDSSLKEELLKDSLVGAISAFDSFGKALRNKYPNKFPQAPKNLFQNYIELDETLRKSFGKNIKDYLSQSDSDFMFKMFQVRHIYEHNAGVIDNDFIRKLPSFSAQKGRKYKLEQSELGQFLYKLSELMTKIYSEVE